MDTQILIKTSPDIQLGHLYEHIFLSQLSDFLRSHESFSLLDYDISGEVFNSGHIVLTLKSYNQSTHQLIQNFLKNQPKIDSEAIASAALQIFAEKIADSGGFSDNYEEVLDDLNRQTWHDLNEIDSVDNQSTQDEIINLTPAKANDFWNIELELNYKKPTINDPLAPIFCALAKIITNSAIEIIENNLHSFTTEVSQLKICDNVLTFETKFRRSKRQEFNEIEEKSLIIELINSLKNPEVVTKIIAELCLPNQTLVNANEMVLTTSSILGKNFFIKHATAKNILAILDAISVELHARQ